LPDGVRGIASAKRTAASRLYQQLVAERGWDPEDYADRTLRGVLGDLLRA
jgi:hypothetical protein